MFTLNPQGVKTSPKRAVLLWPVISAGQCDSSIPPYFCFSSVGLCTAVHWRRCPSKSIQIQPDRRQKAGCRARRKKNTRKSRESTNKNPENATTTCSDWNRSQICGGEFTCLPRNQRSGLSENQEPGLAISEPGVRARTN